MNNENTPKPNFSLMLEKTIKELDGKRPRLLLHACCAPCSSYVLEYLSEFFDITLFFYNPNISPKEEYDFRAEELRKLVSLMGLDGKVSIICEKYDSAPFDNIAKGKEELAEGGARCADCYRLRLSKAARVAAEGGFDYVTTTLSISPYKNALWLNTIGAEEAEKHGVKYLFSDFKKKNGYKRSCELSEKYDLYRKSYCG
jgi:predicted adenine nucleotide alpha hydrolase (AANH) superfamily ATPase